MLRPDHALAKRESITIDDLAEHRLVLRPRHVSKGAHDVILAMFHGNPPASTSVADAYSGATWDAMHDDGFAVMPSSAAVGGDFIAVPIADTTDEFTISLLWSTDTPPAVLPRLLEAADGAAVENGWR